MIFLKLWSWFVVAVRRKRLRLRQEKRERAMRGEDAQIEVDLDDALPFDIWEEIFMHVDFATNCRLRSVCRKWNSLLQSPPVLRNIIFDVPPSLKDNDCPAEFTKYEEYDEFDWTHNCTPDRVIMDRRKFILCYRQIAVHVQNIFFIRDYLKTTSLKLKNEIKNPDQGGYVQRIVSACLEEHEDSLLSGDIYLSNLWTSLVSVENCVTAITRRSGGSVVVRNCQFRGSHTWLALVREVRAFYWDRPAWEKFVFHVPGPYLLPLEPSGSAWGNTGLVLRMAFDNATGLTDAQMNSVGELISRLDDEELEYLQASLWNIFAHATSYWDVPPELTRRAGNRGKYLRHLKIRSLHPLITQIIHFEVCNGGWIEHPLRSKIGRYLDCSLDEANSSRKYQHK